MSKSAKKWDSSYEWKAVLLLGFGFGLVGLDRWISFFSLGNVALIAGPIATESAPAGLISAAIGIVVASGEIFGGGVAPVIGGTIAQGRGIQNILWMPLVGVSLGALVSLFLKETAPVKVGAATPVRSAEAH
jgi:hypothetical protein